MSSFGKLPQPSAEKSDDKVHVQIGKFSEEVSRKDLGSDYIGPEKALEALERAVKEKVFSDLKPRENE